MDRGVRCSFRMASALVIAAAAPAVACSDSGSSGSDEVAHTEGQDSLDGPTGDAEGQDDASTTSADSQDSSDTDSQDSSDSADGTTTTADGSSSEEEDDDDASDEGPKFDLEPIPDGGLDCECGSELEFSYIWIANTNDSTVSKLNTETMEEVGRFLTRQDANGSPSRTSVALSGRAVAVANRNGGVVKVLAQHEDCDEMNNGQPGLQTSMNGTPLPWGQDDCVDWYVPFNYTTQRPVAWAPGVLNESTCEYESEKVWTAGCTPGQMAAPTVSLIDGDTGAIEFEVVANGFECSSLSPYGGAVNADGDFWFTNLVPGNDQLGFVDRETQEFVLRQMPITPYGMTVDEFGNPWIASWAANQSASAARFNVDDETWDFANNHVAYSLSGIQQDGEGRMWMNYWQYDGQNMGTGGLVYIDMETMLVSEPFDLGCQTNTCRGMSVDLNGMIWSTSQASNTAFRFNPDTLEVDTYNQLNGPYTYSDMTGWGIQSAACGDPQG